MQFVPKGPDIPDRLLQEHEDGNVIFFCGAGISYPAGLPGFQGLVKSIYERLGEPPSAIENAAIKNQQYDTAIGLLEGRIVGGRSSVREHISAILVPNWDKRNATSTHEALLTLARNRDGRYRLVTCVIHHLHGSTSKVMLGLENFRIALDNFSASCSEVMIVPLGKSDRRIYLSFGSILHLKNR